jgi:hypothetical protein
LFTCVAVTFAPTKRYASFPTCLPSFLLIITSHNFPTFLLFSVWLLFTALLCVDLGLFCRLYARLSLSSIPVVTFCHLSVVRFGFLPSLSVVHFPWSALMLCLIAESSELGPPCFLRVVLSAMVSFTPDGKFPFQPLVRLPFVSLPPFIVVWLLLMVVGLLVVDPFGRDRFSCPPRSVMLYDLWCRQFLPIIFDNRIFLQHFFISL